MSGAKIRPFKITSPEYDLTRVTEGERLLLWRYRQRRKAEGTMGRNGNAPGQAEAAAALGVSPGAYVNLESDRDAVLSAGEAARISAAIATVRPTVAELCLLARRRSGRPLAELEDEVGISRPTWHARERCGDLVSYWEESGFKFPALDQ
jgi:DNA-binding XRE family transcriptional regulator